MAKKSKKRKIRFPKKKPVRKRKIVKRKKTGRKITAKKLKKKNPKKKKKKVFSVKSGKKRPKREIQAIKKQKPPEEKPGIFDNVYQTRIKIIGIGGGGCSIVSEIASRLKRVNFIAANTDLQILRKTNRRCRRFSFGQDLTGGLGCGMNPELGRRAALEARDKIKKILDGADLCILVASLGGGTGSGATPVFAEVSRELKNITFGIFTLPFKFEGEKKMKIALNSLDNTKPNLNSFTVIPNEKIFQIIDKNTPLKQALSALNKILEEGLEGLMEMIFLPGLINIDWADLKTILEGRGKLCYLNSIEGKFNEEPEEIARRAIQGSLSEYNPQRAERILYNISSDKELKMDTVAQVSKFITGFNHRAKIIFGISQRPDYKNKIRITLLATSAEKKEEKIKKEPKPKTEIPAQPELKEKKAEPPKPRGVKVFFLKRKKKISQLKKKKPKKRKIVKVKIKKEELAEERRKPEKIRKNALQLRREAEKIEKEILEEERKWDVPAFLRKRI